LASVWRKLEEDEAEMTVTLHLRPEVEAGLVARAEASGMPLEEYVLALVEDAASAAPPLPEPRKDRADAVQRMLEFGEKYRLGFGEPITRQLLHEGHRF
jgi:hypothetical protein